MEKVVLTREMIEAGKSSRGGWSNRQVQQLGLPSLNGQKGWQDRLIGTEHDRDKYEMFLALRDGHLTPTKIQKAKERKEAKSRSIKIRMDPEDHAFISRLALRFKKTPAEVAYRALDEYCERRNFPRLKGAPPAAPVFPTTTSPDLTPAPSGVMHVGGGVPDAMRVAAVAKGVARLEKQANQAAMPPRSVAAGEGQPPKPPRAGAPWTAEEQVLVCSDFFEGVPIEEIAQKHQRTRSGILWRIRAVAVDDAELRRLLEQIGEFPGVA